jgi:hypothetical protein
MKPALVHQPMKPVSCGAPQLIGRALDRVFSDSTKKILMRTKQTKPQNTDEYIAGFPDDVQKILEKVRTTIKKAAPDAEETISYKIPTFILKGNYLVISLLTRNISDFILCQEEVRNSRKSCLLTKGERER